MEQSAVYVLVDTACRFCKGQAMHRFSGILACSLFAWFGLSAQANEVLLTKQHLVQLNQGMWAAAKLNLPESDPDLPIIGPENKQDGVRLLRLLMSKNGINGFNQIIYDNRDRGHSRLDPDAYPALRHLKYGAKLKADALDTGLAGRIIFPAVVFGNSSTAITKGDAPRSLPRYAMTHPAWRAVTPLLYQNNQIYVYPEHRDHDDADRFPVNWPYMIISQGSSGSDRRFLNAIALTLAALPADTFSFLRENGLIAPTLQMILRRNLKTVPSREEYLSGAAHPTAFPGRLVQIGRMVEQASQLRPQDVPPLVRLRVVEEDFSQGAGLAGLDERFLDTPAAIGRVWRSFAWERELIVSAEDTESPLDQLLTYEWRLLRGNPERVSIEPMGHNGSVAKIRIRWHDPWREPVAPDMQGKTRRVSRVDIGVFANNGFNDSAPAIISFDFPSHQRRQYSVQADGEIRISSIDYDAAGRDAYFDPLVYWSAAWTDTARYDESGKKFLGWDRVSADGVSTDVAADDPPRYELDVSDISSPVLRHSGQEAQAETE